ncbi:CHAP domain-containing protein [Streptomyces sp. CB03238]|uniref:CHAP domain-containing protein n=1 Tax=Streptomyces sp. CB03238 TaxID=1907777 RepID=UPI000D1B44C3|nr:CHAP domain-containing protein [Streptomyces sp. CB03238]
MASTAAAMLAEARKWKGYKEGASNHTRFGEWYATLVKDKSFAYAAWCDEYVSYCGYASGNADVVGQFAYCPSHVNWFKKRGQWHKATETIEPGDILFFDWNDDGIADHVEIATAASAPGATIATIGGNTSAGTAGSQSNGDGVYERTRYRSDILGFGRPAYKASSTGGSKPTTPETYKPPTFPKGLAPNKSTPSAKTLQKALKATGWMGKDVELSDNYGPRTQKGVAGFNAKHGLNDKGKTYDPAIGPRGWALLFTLAYG